ncbi:uncharacterized protein LOC106390633 isoform X1 [Brassica napus]|uniref:uncharacterized protein LOC106390633 isoform X1 n=1 Tax=Brassica napus TaxID=3708 RepID=UPI0006AAD075|nr:uncharacterized protein LOC106390633 isoform X1 [Brassica napus]XP_013686593.1 uncharacterized protein LOC106390633 isoform X1 [Brassica napus]
MSLDMLLLDSMATLMQASVNVSRLATYMPYLQAGSIQLHLTNMIMECRVCSTLALLEVFFQDHVLGSCLLPCMLLLVLMRDQILSIIFLKFEGWSMYLHLEVASLDFGKRWQAQGYGQDKLTLMQATTSEYLQHLSKAGSMYSVTGFEVTRSNLNFNLYSVLKF